MPYTPPMPNLRDPSAFEAQILAYVIMIGSWPVDPTTHGPCSAIMCSLGIMPWPAICPTDPGGNKVVVGQGVGGL